MNLPLSDYALEKEFFAFCLMLRHQILFLFQARYRQYFEEEPDPNMDAGMILIETQVLMQEVLTDGMAFCSLM